MNKQYVPSLIVAIAIILAALILGLCQRYEIVLTGGEQPTRCRIDRLTGKVWILGYNGFAAIPDAPSH